MNRVTAVVLSLGLLFPSIATAEDAEDLSEGSAVSAPSTRSSKTSPDERHLQSFNSIQESMRHADDQNSSAHPSNERATSLAAKPGKARQDAQQ